MTHDEQHRMVLELLDVEHRIKGPDLDRFRMLAKRDHDDEDLDTLSQKTLQELHRTYTGRRSS
jgi:hypothetical protein